jgi:DNA-binding transcriptional MerR regulator
MAEIELLPPNDVSRSLGISPSTLRRWSAEFADLLSDAAGRPEPSPQGEPAHRRYTADDVAVLGQVGDLLRRGLTYRQIAAHLGDKPRSDAEGAPPTSDPAEPKSVVLHQPARVVAPAFNIITDALQSVVDNQQSVLSSQQANRDLLGVVIQDNFNLKEENSRLRDRMLHMERELSEVRRHNDETRAELLERLNELESDAETKPRRGCLAAVFGIQ